MIIQKIKLLALTALVGVVSACGSIKPEAPATANQVVPAKPMPAIASTVDQSKDGLNQ